MPMSLDGLRAWIGEVERKLGIRTRVFLVLLAIAIGASGAAIYLALEADDGGNGGGASAEEVQSLREQVELEGGGGDTAALEAQIAELRGEVDALQAGQEGGSGGTSSGGGSGTGSTGGGAEAGAIPEKEAKKIPESEAEK
jgi:hypothetical protein